MLNGGSGWRAEPMLRANSLYAPVPIARSGSMRLHGFHQNRALCGGGLRNAEMKYLKLAAEGNVEMVDRMFKKYPNDNLNQNCTDYFDRTALTLAITNKRERMIKYLLDAGVELTESLFYAIDNEYTEAVEYILKSVESRGKLHEDMLITSEESIFPRFLSPIMLAAHKNNYEILEILYNYSHRLKDFSINAANKWDEMRLKWLYYKARASQAFMILMWNKEKVDPLNEAIDFYGILMEEGVRTREMRENLKQLAIQCEDFAIALLDQLRTAQELADILRFSLVGREHGNTNQLVLHTLPDIPESSWRQDSDRKSVHSMQNSHEISPTVDDPLSNMAATAIPLSEVKKNGTLGRRGDSSSITAQNASVDQHGVAQYIRSVTDAQVTTAKIETLKRIASPGDAVFRTPEHNISRASAVNGVPDERRRTLGIRRSHPDAINTEYARPIHFLKPIEKAVDNGMIRLVTCENSQLALTYLKDGLLFRDTSPSMQLFKKFLIAFLFPLVSLAFYFKPNSKIGLIARNPTAKLWMEVASDICLIGLLVMNLILSEIGVIKPQDFSWVLIVAYLWMPGKFLNLCFLAYHQRKRVLYSIWNWNDFATSLLYTGFMILRIMHVYTQDESGHQWSPVPFSDMMISVVYVLVFLRPLEILRVNRTFGPLQVSVDRMMKDVSKFFLLFLVVWFAFSSGVNTLFWRYKGLWNKHYKRCDPNGSVHASNISDSSLKSGPTCCFEHEGNAKFTTFVQSLRVHFWSVFGYSDDYANWFELDCADGQDRSTTEAFGEIIFALYHVGTVLVLINMLIAIMSGTLQKTTGESDIQWQFHRTRLWIRFIRTGFYRPPPMNIVPRPKDMAFIGKISAKAFASIFRRRRQNFNVEEQQPSPTVVRSSVNPCSTERIEDKRTANALETTRFREKYSRSSIDSSMGSIDEESGSRYDFTLSKCVKRYLKARVIQGEDLCDST